MTSGRARNWRIATIKTLIVMRHGHAENEILSAGLSPDEWHARDHARGLEPEGRAAAESTAAQIRERVGVPDAIVASDAVRARRTAECAAAALGFSEPVHLEAGAYDGADPAPLATGEELLEVVKEFPANADIVLFVAHAPGVDRLAERLTGAEDEAFALQRAGAAHLELDVPGWSEAGPSAARLLAEIEPGLPPTA
jgi:phosphohistidine phosphatase